MIVVIYNLLILLIFLFIGFRICNLKPLSTSKIDPIDINQINFEKISTGNYVISLTRDNKIYYSNCVHPHRMHLTNFYSNEWTTYALSAQIYTKYVIDRYKVYFQRIKKQTLMDMPMDEYLNLPLINFTESQKNEYFDILSEKQLK